MESTDSLNSETWGVSSMKSLGLPQIGGGKEAEDRSDSFLFFPLFSFSTFSEKEKNPQSEIPNSLWCFQPYSAQKGAAGETIHLWLIHEAQA